MNSPEVHNTFSGTFDIVHLGTFLYEGHERNWSAVGYTDEENAELNRKLGRLFEVKLYSSLLGSFPNGKPRYVTGAGKSLEEALDKARFQAIFAYARMTLENFGWKKV